MLKRLSIGLVLLAIVAFGYLYGQAVRSQEEAPPSVTAVAAPNNSLTIAFGSCNRQNEPQDYWATIGSHAPAAWLWLGDNVYADTDDMVQMRADYATLENAPEYQAFLAATPLVYGAWDDHDYGKNDAGKEWAARDEAKVLMLDFLQVPDDAAVRQRAGTYQAYDIGDIRVILLDTRYFRDALAPPTRPGDRYGADPDGDILGDAQWAWLEDQLRNSNAKAHLIASSIQVLPTDHGYEKWANFPTARARLLHLLAEVRPALPLLLSGDRHLAEFSVDSVGDYPVYELTASGLTHTYKNAKEANDKRIGSLIAERNFGLLHFTTTPAGLQLTAEVRAIDNNAVLATLALPNSLMPRTLQPCPDSPNCVSTQTDQPKKKRDPIPFTGSAEDAMARIKTVVSAMSRTTLVEEDEHYLHYTFKTWPIPYIDDVEFVIDPAEQVIHYRSASRVGHSDLGVNGRRMAKVVAAFASN
ncbi:hypothetical protein LEM8419_01961 [Neolewinella maritima]|uniref:PhoD-like phosphatase metallophosphatase domain-containing protein n=1 Tax=Neolewinella maritima TaxID=1383882 RepID=A0ABM9B140_9BACT|nr:DUF1499 domain-containing protein [Neolewinella maritima]CAH1000940.1 hypothetical protein LEM8419_01961 [Neolewinella maritima]